MRECSSARATASPESMRLAVVIFFLYVNLITVGKVWIARGTIPEYLGLWWTHAVVVLLALGVIVGPGLAYRLRYRIRGL